MAENWRKQYAKGNFAPPKGLDNLTKAEYEAATKIYQLLSGGGDAGKPAAALLRKSATVNANRLADEMLREKERRVGGASPDWDTQMALALGPAQGAAAALGWKAAPAAMEVAGDLPDVPAGVLGFGSQAAKMSPAAKAMFVPMVGQMIAQRAPRAMGALGSVLAPVASALGSRLTPQMKEKLRALLGEDTSHAMTPEEQALINMTYPSRMR